jgi:hypothetical protein
MDMYERRLPKFNQDKRKIKKLEFSTPSRVFKRAGRCHSERPQGTGVLGRTTFERP